MNAPLPPSCEQAMTELATLPPQTSRGSWSRNALEQLLLLGRLDEPHRPLLEAERRELASVEFEEDIDQRVAEAEEVEFFGHHAFPFFSILAHVSRSVTARLKTSLPGVESRSTQK